MMFGAHVQEQALQETEVMLPDCEVRIKKATEDLKALIVGESE